MGKLSQKQLFWLEETFGDRLSTRRVELKLYSHDIGEMPSMIKPLIGTPLADAVVQPESEDEIIQLVKWAAGENIPLVPRGKATSGYGGVLPVKGGVVIDFFRMSHVVSVDVEAQTATLQAIPNVTYVDMPYNRDEAHCCGSVLTLIKDPPIAAIIGKHRLDEATEVGAQKVLAACPCCEFQFRVSKEKKSLDIEIVDLARFCAEALGFDNFPDPHPEVQAQWAVFEAMIELMTPAGFAALMGTMWPELIDAMPFGMGKMMRVMGKIPGALGLMKPMFPFLFPKLLPMMMPKVMDTMLERVGTIIPMPDYMAEQMPDIMPGVMDNLMPHMIDDVVPLVTGPMIEYLKNA